MCGLYAAIWWQQWEEHGDMATAKQKGSVAEQGLALEGTGIDLAKTEEDVISTSLVKRSGQQLLDHQ
jgi:hypothetical protein